MTFSTPDQSARERALEPRGSFIVQAPAGSGKTELLTQRYLVLLAHAQQAPEEIIAITFTRKAAAEMQARILAALEKAAGPEPEAAHAKNTWQLARNALRKDQQLQWNILENPHRLRILTIDSLCASLARQLPVLSGLGGAVTISSEPLPHYQQAARKLLASLENSTEWSSALDTLLLHVDNDHQKAERLLVDMLAKRDQWLHYLAGSQDARHLFEDALANVVIENMEKAAAALPEVWIDELLALARFAAANLPAGSASNPIRHCLELQQLPACCLEDYSQWLGLANLLLTQSKQWRKKLSQKEGFPAPSSCKDKAQKAVLTEMKQRMEQLLESCTPLAALQQALQDLLESPPVCFSDQQWQVIDALLQLLPILAAHLRLEFQLHGEVDYIEIANSALAALGEPDNPTDLALALDYKIQHILIDEFQDTSANQYRLLEQLTAGWQPDDGRTLFLVGDPMQSIYRFRKAEVGLFLRAREYGIGHIALEPLNLTANFRSHTNIVEWINTAFAPILPAIEDIGSGAVAYRPSIAIHQHDVLSEVKTYPFYRNDFAAEAQQVVNIIQLTLAANPRASIAILVRAKTHLAEIFPALQAAGIPYQAVDIDPLLQRPIIQDLLALTQALLHFADRTAWLAILRAPWCGLTLTDLHALAGHDHQQTVWEQLQHYQQRPLSADGLQRVQRLMTVLHVQLPYRQRISLRRWVEATWLLLGGLSCAASATDLQDAQTFFELLETVDEGGIIANIEQLTLRLQKLYAAPNASSAINVEIMSIHKAKGLEFDTVILPGLGRALPNDDPQLLLWMERPRIHGGTDLLVAPMRSAYEANDPIYRYLQREENRKADYETGRLLYVAATRAKTQLHLLGHCLVDNSGGSPQLKLHNKSLLAQLWPMVEGQFQLNVNQAGTDGETALFEPTPNLLKRLKINELLYSE